QRLLAPPCPGLPDPEDLQLLVGQLPDAVRDELPLPEGVRVVGSLVRGRWRTEVVLDAEGPAEHVRASFRKALKAAGRRRRRFPPPATFEKGFQANDFLAFYRSPRGTDLSLTVRQRPGTPTDVRLDLDYHRQWPETRPKRREQVGLSATPEAEALAR